MSSTAWLLSAGFGVLMLLGVPFAFGIGIVVAVALLVSGIEPMLMPQSMVAGTQSFSLLASPFFMLAGELMTAGGLSARLVKVADVFVRHLTGGLGHVTVVAATVFAAISGSARLQGQLGRQGRPAQPQVEPDAGRMAEERRARRSVLVPHRRRSPLAGRAGPSLLLRHHQGHRLDP